MSNSATNGVVKLTRNWRGVLSVLILTTVFISLYFDALTQLISNIRTSEGSHGLLILGVIVYLIWLKKDDFATLEQTPAVLLGTLLAIAGFFTLFAASLTETMVLQQLSMIPSLLGLILLIYGYSFFKALFIPVCYLVFLTGFIEMLLWSQAIHFQRISAEIAVFLLKLTGMPVLYSGLIIDLPHISLEVARACSGIGHIVSLMALSVPLAMMSQLTQFRKCVLVVASFFIGFFANGVRIALIGIYALYNEGADLHGPNETLYVTFIFFFGMVLLIFLSHLLSKKKTRFSPDESVEEETQKKIEVEALDAVDTAANSNFTQKTYSHWLIALLIVGTSFLLVNFYKITPVALDHPLEKISTNIGGFVGTTMRSIDERLRPFQIDDELLRTYTDPSGRRLQFYIGYSTEQNQARKIFDKRRTWMHDESQPISVETSGGSFTINKTRLKDNYNPPDIYFWYIMDDRIITNQYVGKLYTFWNGLIKQRTNGAVVVVQTHNSQEEVMPFLAELVPLVKDVVGSGKSRQQDAED